MRTMVFVGSLLYIATLHPDRRRLHLGRSAGAAGLRATMPKFVLLVDRRRDLAAGRWRSSLYVLARAAPARRCARPGRRCSRDAAALSVVGGAAAVPGADAARQRALPRRCCRRRAGSDGRRRRPTTRARARCSTRCSRGLVRFARGHLLAAAGLRAASPRNRWRSTARSSASRRGCSSAART